MSLLQKKETEHDVDHFSEIQQWYRFTFLC